VASSPAIFDSLKRVIGAIQWRAVGIGTPCSAVWIYFASHSAMASSVSCFNSSARHQPRSAPAGSAGLVGHQEALSCLVLFACSRLPASESSFRRLVLSVHPRLNCSDVAKAMAREIADKYGSRLDSRDTQMMWRMLAPASDGKAFVRFPPHLLARTDADAKEG